MINKTVVKGIPFVGPEGLTFLRVKKTKPIQVKPINVILNDTSILAKFLLDTIEGHASLKSGAMVCIGEAGDAWLQDKKKVIAKYNLTDVNEEGWITCVPKPENEARCCEISFDFCVFAYYGEDYVVDGEKKHVLFGKAGDFLFNSIEDPNDFWIVARKLFFSTYEEIK